jgi:uncharacterized protein (DUF1501 family)
MSYTTLSRRDFLKLTSCGYAAWSLGLPTWTPRLAFAPQGVESPADVLVCIFLRGGLDGLNAVPPMFEAEYYRKRPELAVPENQSGDESTSIDLDGRFGLHPALAPLKDVWDAGHLAIIHAVGSPDPTHSHFDAMDFMERGTPGEKSIPTGWIGRHLNTAPWQNESLLRAVGMGGIRQTSLRGPVPVTSLQSIADFHLQGDVSQLASLQQTLSSLYETGGDLAQAAQNTLDAIEILSRVDVSSYDPGNAAEYPEGEFGLALSQVAQLAKAQVGLEVACIDIGGFDTHANEGVTEGILPSLLGEFGNGLKALYLDTRDLSQEVTVIVMSEFGRRLAENASRGTDHGHGNIMLTLGPGVNGGAVYTQWPGLSPEQLYGPGDLDVTTDFRDVLAELVTRRLANAVSVAEVFPGYTPDLKGIYKLKA